MYNLIINIVLLY